MLHLSVVIKYETVSVCLMADVWYSLDRDTARRGNGSPRLLMSRWGSQSRAGKHLLIFHPVHLHNKQEIHQVSQLSHSQSNSDCLRNQENKNARLLAYQEPSLLSSSWSEEFMKYSGLRGRKKDGVSGQEAQEGADRRKRIHYALNKLEWVGEP